MTPRGDASPAAQPQRLAGEPRAWGRIVVAALALPGVAPVLHAEEPPERAELSLRWLDFRDWQPVAQRFPGYSGAEGGRLDRIRVRSPSVHGVLPLASRWSVEGSLAGDDVSGATPRAYSDVSTATTPARGSGMTDHRTAADVKVTRYYDRSAWGVRTAWSGENDYRSLALALDGRLASADQNTTLSLGLGGSADRIDSVLGNANGKRRRTLEATLGLTQALSPQDLAQATVHFTHGRGYFSDPYKAKDERPRRRDQLALLLRWNHHVTDWQASWRLSYRYYLDSWKVHSHTLEAAWAQRLDDRFTLTPLLRVYSQGSASFYADPSPAPFYPDAPGSPRPYSADQRLAAFGARSWGLNLAWRIDADWSADLQYERYRQRSGWRLLGKASPGIDDLHARSVQVGLRRAF